MKLTLEQKKEIEIKILEHKSSWNDETKFEWFENDTVKFFGSVYVSKNATLEAPQLTSIGGFVYVSENATLEAPQLTSVGDDLYIYPNATLEAPQLANIGNDLEIYSNTSLPQLKNVGGSLEIYPNTTLPQLTSVGGQLYIHSNATLPQLTSVGGYLEINSNATLEAPQLTSVGGYLEINSNATLEAPQLANIGNDLYINSNATLNAPQLANIGNDLYIKSNATLEAPQLINEDFVRDMKQGEEKYGWIKADGIGLPFDKKRKQGNYTIYVTPFKVSNYNYVITDGTHYAHSKSIRQGILDINFKNAKRDMEKYRDLGLEHELTYDEAVIMYRLITGACSGGTQQFLLNHPELTNKRKYTISQVLDLTKGQFGHDRLVEFFE